MGSGRAASLGLTVEASFMMNQVDSSLVLMITLCARIFLTYSFFFMLLFLFSFNVNCSLLQDVSNKLEERKDECLSQLKENDM